MAARRASEEIATGDRFAFGANWRSFLELIDEERIKASMDGLEEYLGVGSLDERSFLDIGSGSGLSSLAARRLGARVVSFDFDPDSVACTQELRRRESASDEDWRVFQGSALDTAMLRDLGQFDVVYSWGVLHHTGDMWTGLQNAAGLVAPGGRLFLALYNDQGLQSRVWARVKASYNESGPMRRWALLQASRSYFNGRTALARLAKGQLRRSHADRGRGMDRERDLLDWVGGWPFEVSRPDEVFKFYRDCGFDLEVLSTCGGGLGCNQFVFRKRVSAGDASR